MIGTKRLPHSCIRASRTRHVIYQLPHTTEIPQPESSSRRARADRRKAAAEEQEQTEGRARADDGRAESRRKEMLRVPTAALAAARRLPALRRFPHTTAALTTLRASSSTLAAGEPSFNECVELYFNEASCSASTGALGPCASTWVLRDRLPRLPTTARASSWSSKRWTPCSPSSTSCLRRCCPAPDPPSVNPAGCPQVLHRRRQGPQQAARDSSLPGPAFPPPPPHVGPRREGGEERKTPAAV